MSGPDFPTSSGGGTNAWVQRSWFVLRWGALLGLGWQFGWLWGLLAAFAYPLLLLPVFLALTGLQEDAVRPGLGAVLRAWLGEVRASELSFGWRQPWRTAAEPDHLPAGATQGVLLVHGFACNRAFWNGWMARLRVQGVAFVAPTLEPAFGSIDGYADLIEAGVQRLEALTGSPPLIVCHSMGGLAVRAWWRRHPRAQAPQVITLGSPHGGTWMANLSPMANARQMRRHSNWIRALPSLPRLICVWTPCDQLVMPASTAVLPGAEAVRLDDVGHVGLVNDPRAWAVVQTALASSLSTPRRI